MTRDARYKKVVRRHAQDTGQRYTEALTHLEGLEDRLFHEPVADRLLAHLRTHHGIDAVAATRLSQHNDHVFRIDRADGPPWIARVFPPARPAAGAEGDAAVLRSLERHGYPAERPAADDPVSSFDGSSVLVTRYVDGHLLPSPAVGAEGVEKMAVLGDLLGRLHARPTDELDPGATRPGGAGGDDPRREGRPAQDVLGALAFLDAVATRVGRVAGDRFAELRAQVAAADAGEGLPEALVHGNLLHAPDHVVVGGDGPVVIQWRAAGLGPRLADVAFLFWGTWLDPDWIRAAADAYRRHVTLTAEELDRLEGVMAVRPLYLAAFDWRRALAADRQPTLDDPWWDQPDLGYIAAVAARARDALAT
jgi:Ser/Thr protein kinase RdoA (MazF antagonist)